MYKISNQQHDILLRAVSLLSEFRPQMNTKQREVVRMATLAARKLENKKPIKGQNHGKTDKE